MKKLDLQKEGYDPSSISDNIFYLDASSEYKPLTLDIYNKINDGTIRLWCSSVIAETDGLFIIRKWRGLLIVESLQEVKS